MPIMFQFLIVFFISSLPFSYSQVGSPQNIETFFPAPSPPPTPTTPPISPPLTPSISPPPATPLRSSSSNTGDIVTAVAVTAASTLVLVTLFFFLLRKCAAARRKKEKENDGRAQGGLPVFSRESFGRFDGTVKGLIVDENGLDVIYWRRLQGRSKSSRSRKQIMPSARTDVDEEEEEEEGKRMAYRGSRRERKQVQIQEIPLLRGKSSTSHVKIHEDHMADGNYKARPPLPLPRPSHGITISAIEKVKAPIQPSNPPPPPAVPQSSSAVQNSKKSSAPPPPPPPSSPPAPQQSSLIVQNSKKNPAPPPPPTPAKRSPAPPPPPTPAKRSPAPPPPPTPAKRSPAPPPPPPPGPAAAPAKPPPIPTGGSSSKPSSSVQDNSGTGNGQVKLKPLHWDKVTARADHSMVWDKIDGGSFRFDGDLMEALFGFVASNKKSPPRNGNSCNPENANSGSSAQTFILDPRKSQNIAIVLKSLGMSRQEIINVLIDGSDADADILEKLTRIAPTKEEEALILEFEGDPRKLADAESFLYHLLKAIPSAFTRLDAMVFRLNYDSEILHLKESLQTIELGCKELRTRGLFMKLLEAILKAGNRMNAGTARGNAQAFNLNALRKLSDVKSIDGKTTLLHFVVEEVVRSEGKRCVFNRNRSLTRSSSKSSSSGSLNSETMVSKEEKENEYVMLGLPIVGGLSADFSNVKKAAAIDFDTFSATSSALATRAAEIRQLVSLCASDGEGGFMVNMKGFLDSADEELKVVKEEQTRVMELLKKTTEYYQAGASKDKATNPLQLFVIIRDFLGMVDHVCVEIARNLQRRKTSNAGLGSSPPKSLASRTPVKFPILPENFITDKSRSTSSKSDSDS